MGLLKSASEKEHSFSAPRISFKQFLERHRLKHCAVLRLSESLFFVCHSYGLDGQTIISATSTKDFWDGLVPDDGKPHVFSDTAAAPLLQLFSPDSKETIESLCAVRTGGTLLLACDTTAHERLAEDFAAVDFPAVILPGTFAKNTSAMAYELDVSGALKEFLHTQECADEEKIRSALEAELFMRLAFYTGSAAVTGGKIRFVLADEELPPVKLLSAHITVSFADVLEKGAQKLTLSECKSITSTEEAGKFLRAE